MLPDNPEGTTRRRFLQSSLLLGGLALFKGPVGWASEPPAVQLPFDRGRRPLVVFPQKRPLMLLTTRPPQLETPFQVFRESVFTPNDAFFVRWHLPNIPTKIQLDRFRLQIRGRVKHALSLSLADLRRNYENVELSAVCQCAGNSRGFFNPRVPGGQWGHGAMGNARWRGIRLRDLLKKAGLESDAVSVRFNGLDQPVAESTPDFRKSLPIDDALSESVLVAFAMNGEPLPFLNGFPLRLVVPGWYATYWMKMLHDIEVLAAQDNGFWMTRAYRLPADPCGCLDPGETPQATVPLGRMTVRSFITNVDQDASLPSGRPFTVTGIAFDEGYGIDRVLFSHDGGQSWQSAHLGEDFGNFSFRPWKARFTPTAGVTHRLQSLAINRIGETQRFSPRWNPSGYLRNAVETVVAKGGREP